MKKLGYLLLALVLVTGCGTADSGVVDDSVAKEEGFMISVEGIDLYTDISLVESVELISEDYSYFEATSCAHDGIDKIYTYRDYVATFYEVNGEDLLFSVVLKNDLIETKDGVYIGMDYDSVVSIYGDDFTSTENAITFIKGDSLLYFIFSDDVVTSIELSKVINQYDEIFKK